MKRVAILTIALALLVAPAIADAAPEPAWKVTSLAAPTNFEPGSTGDDYYQVEFTNIGAAPTDGDPIVVTDTLPANLVVEEVSLLRNSEGIFPDLADEACEEATAAGVATVTCTIDESLTGASEPAILWPSERMVLIVHVAPPLSVSGTLANHVTVQGGGAGADSASSENLASPDPAPPGVAEFRTELLTQDGALASQAASYPFAYTTSFAVNTELAPEGSLADLLGAGGDLKDLKVALPPGLIGNPTAAARCTAEQFTTSKTVFVGERSYIENLCPPESAVGVIAVRQVEGRSNIPALGPVYNLVPPPGMPAQLGFQVIGAPIYIDTAVRSDSDYGVTATLRNTSQAKRITSGMVTLWGVPGDPVHDRLRGECADTGLMCPIVGERLPFLRLPTSCAAPLLTSASIDTWLNPGSFLGANDGASAPSGCASPPFEPTISLDPTTTVADSPTGLDVDLHLPQGDHPEELATADLRDAVVRLPPGLLVNPASADGLAGCSPIQIGLTTPVGQAPPRFTNLPAECPNASKVGSVEVDTPLLDDPLVGGVYLASQSQNPFGSLIAIYIAVADKRTGVVVKLAGEVRPDPNTGQLTTTFENNPQVPFEDFRLSFFPGSRASLRTPPNCGVHTATASMTPHTAPASGPPATSSSSFPINSGPAGPCPNGALAPNLSAGLQTPSAGTFSPFLLRVTRDDATGEFSAVSAVTPEGLTARLAGIPYCSEDAVAAAAARSNPGQGASEGTSPSCPAASAVGTIQAGAGAGPSPFYVSGKVYLAGPYKGAPLSLVAIIPALAGPFDLGVVVDRIALRVNPETAQVTADGDPFPTILAGIPLDVRDIRVNLDRPEFTLAPTDCEPTMVTATVSGPAGAAGVSNRFQVGGCGRLAFNPQLKLALKGGTKRSKNPSLRATLTAKRGQANIARTAVTLPPSVQIDNAHIENPCTRSQFAENACPKGSILGRAVATTPLLDEPLEGFVYFRSNGGVRLLPDVVADLRGQIDVVLVGAVDTVGKRVRTTFATVPDAPVTKFSLKLYGGHRGWLVNNRDICARSYQARVKMTAQNGLVKKSSPRVGTSCRAKR